MFSIFTKAGKVSQANIDHINSVCPFIALEGSYDVRTVLRSDPPNHPHTRATVQVSRDLIAYALHEIGHLISVRLTQDGWAEKAMQNNLGMVGLVPSHDSTLADIEQDANAFVISYLFAKENNLFNETCTIIIPDSEEDLLERFSGVAAKLSAYSKVTPVESHEREYWRKHIEDIYGVLKEGSMNLLWVEACNELRGLRQMEMAEKEEAELV